MNDQKRQGYKVIECISNFKIVFIYKHSVNKYDKEESHT